MKKFLPLIIFTLFITTACGSRLAKQPADESVMVVDPSGSALVEEVDEGDTNDPTDAPDAAEGSLFGSGLKCSDLKSSDSQESCEIQLNDLIGNMLLEDIVSSFDVKRCSELSDLMAFHCELGLEGSTVTGPVSDAELAIFEEIIQGDLPGVNGEGEIPPLYPDYDASKCAQLTSPGYKEYCEDSVITAMQFVELDKIVQSGDSSRCDELDETLSVQCKQFFGVEVPLPEADEGALEEGTVPPGAEVVQ